jgi:multicomponent Na+:H+ antiporter subunit B
MELPLQAMLMLLVVAALAATVLRDVLSAIIVFTIFSLAASVTYVLLSAPDVALTEAAVGAGIDGGGRGCGDHERAVPRDDRADGQTRR